MEPHASGAEVNNGETSLFYNSYDKEVQQDIWNHERKRVTRSLLWVACILLVGDLIAFSIANVLTAVTFGVALIVPLLFCGLAFFARLQPMTAAVTTAVLLAGLMGYAVYAVGPKALVSGWLSKALVVFFTIQAIRQAKEAEAARKKLAEMAC